MENDFLATEKKFPTLNSHFLSFSPANMCFFRWGKNFLSEQKFFCPARWMGHNIFAYLHSFWPHSSLTLRNHNIRLPSLDRVVKNKLMPHLFCPIQNDFCPRQNQNCLRQNIFCPEQKILYMDKKFIISDELYEKNTF